MIPEIQFFKSYNCYLAFSTVSMVILTLFGIITQKNTIYNVVFQCAFVCSFRAQNVKEETANVIIRNVLIILIMPRIALFAMRAVLQVFLLEHDVIDLYTLVSDLQTYNIYISAFYLSKLFYTLVTMAPRPAVRMLISGITLLI